MNFYASTGYLDSLAEVYFRGRRRRVVDVRVGDKVLRLLEVDRRRVITRAQFLDYHEPLDEEEVVGPARAHAFADNVVRGVVEVVPQAAGRRQGGQLAPLVDWSRFPTFADYEALLVERQRGVVRERQRRGRRLAEALGDPVFTLDDPRDDVIALARRWKGRQLRESGLPDFFADPRTTELLGLLRARGLLTSSTLRARGRLLAAWIGFVHDDSWSGWIFTYDPELAKYSPGHQLLHAMLAESHRRGHRELDFSTGAERYKMLYATHARVLGPLGHPPLRRRLVAGARTEAQRRAPRLLEGARAVKRAVRGPAPMAPPIEMTPAKFDTAPPAEEAPRSARLWRRAKAVVLRDASALVLPVLQRVARDHVGGETVDDALAVARKLARDGASSTLGYWETAESVGRPAVDVYLSALEQLSRSGIDNTLSIKPPAMRFDARWATELAASAARLRVRVHCDSHGPEVADASHAMEQAMLDHLPPTSLSTTLPGRWARSLDDADWLIERGLAVRVVKGQWPDPADPRRDPRDGFLDVIDRLAGRVRRVGVATHDLSLAKEALARLKATDTPCELELLFGRPMADCLAWARENRVRVRIYVPFGKGYLPSAIGILRRNPQLALRVVRSLALEKLVDTPSNEKGDQPAAPLEDTQALRPLRPFALDRRHLAVPEATRE